MNDVGFRELRNAFGSYPTGVTVATCAYTDGRAVGVTANSFVSLSLSPPLVSIALRAFLDSAAFTINVLRADQHALSNLFARPSECSWEGVRYRMMPSGHVVIESTAPADLRDHWSAHTIGWG